MILGLWYENLDTSDTLPKFKACFMPRVNKFGNCLLHAVFSLTIVQ